MKKHVFLALALLVFALCACSAPAKPAKTDGAVPALAPVSSTEEKTVLTPVIDAPDSLTLRLSPFAETSVEIPQATAKDEEGNEYPVVLEGEYDPEVPGEYDLVFVTRDAEGARVEKPFRLVLLASPFDAAGNLVDGTYLTDKGFEMKIENGIASVDGILIANKSYPLPRDYAPGGILPEAMAAFQEMRAAAPDTVRGRIFIDSGYRSWTDQYIIFNGYCRRDGQAKAETYSARPGHSEHQSGLAMDIVCSDSTLVSLPGYKEPLAWLNENAWKFGFILRYPEGKTDETGYKFESWHYRFVGKDLAAVLYNNGDWITVEDYFGIDSVYQN